MNERVKAGALFPLLLLGAIAIALLALSLAFRPRRHATEQMPHAMANALIYTADDGALTEFWLVDADHPTTRRLIQSIDHTPGWDGNALVAPDGNSVVFTRLPRGKANPDSDAELWLLNVADRQTRLLAGAVDLRGTLLWSDDSSTVLFERWDGQREQLWRQAIGGGAAALVSEPAEGTVLAPLGLADGDEELLAAEYTARGTDVVRVGGGGQVQPLAHLSDGTARGFALSPDMKRLAFLTVDSSVAPALSRGETLDLGTGAVDSLPEGWGEIIGLVWRPTDTLTAGAAGSAPALHDGDADVIKPGGAGFEQPLAWSPTGKYLALRAFSGESGNAPGSARDEVLSADGSVFQLATGQPVRFVGWLEPTSAAGRR
jgi:dipeptidyl aminopeptidase/acylaminoacyl peptidase